MSTLRQAAQAVIDQWDGPDWEVNDIAQIDAVYSALRTALAAPEQEQEPDAVRHSFDGYGWMYKDNGSGSNWFESAMRYVDAEPMFSTPPDIEELTKERDELIVALKFVESVYRQNFVAVGEPSSTLAYMQSVIAKAGVQ